MTIALRPYQLELDGYVSAAWNAGARVVLMRLDTGGGKTRLFASIIERHGGASCLMAHRGEIVAQISLALAVLGVRHNIIADPKACRAISDLHVEETGSCFYDPNAPCAVASVDTLIRRKGLEKWAATVTLWIVDEGHHLVLDNKWHRAISMFTHPKCRGLLPTATPKRADGQGLGRANPHGGNGMADVMVEGPPMRWLIDEGYLCDYAPPICADSHLVELLGEVGKSGDWSSAQLRAADEQSPIVGDAVRTYLKWAKGKTTILFASCVATAFDLLNGFRSAGVAAELVTGETDPNVRRLIFKNLEKRTVQVVIAVDIVSEGTDIPALECGIFTRTTASLAVYMQQLGRTLRPLPTPEYKAARTREERLAAIASSPKPHALIIDHVGNFMRHGPPDKPRVWSLASTSGRSGPSDAIPMRACLNPECAHPYERFHPACPYCGEVPPAPAGRSSPDMVEGDMVMMDPEILAALRGEADLAVISLDEYRMRLAATGLPTAYIHRNAKSHAAKINAQENLRAVMAWWGGIQHAKRLDDRQIQRLFWLRFDVDVFTAQTLGAADAIALMDKIAVDFTAN